MDEPEHTPESLGEWSLLAKERGPNKEIWLVNDVKRMTITLHSFTDSEEEVKKYAHYLTACVNAMEGYNPEAIPKLVEAVEKLGNVKHRTDTVNPHYVSCSPTHLNELQDALNGVIKS